jgi:hypothetical protein
VRRYIERWVDRAGIPGPTALVGAPRHGYGIVGEIETPYGVLDRLAADGAGSTTP